MAGVDPPPPAIVRSVNIRVIQRINNSLQFHNGDWGSNSDAAGINVLMEIWEAASNRNISHHVSVVSDFLLSNTLMSVLTNLTNKGVKVMDDCQMIHVITFCELELA